MIIFGRVKEVLPNFIKVLVFGKSDSRTAPQSLPFGIDSKPVNDLLAVYAETDNNGNSAVIGYIKKSELTEIGELRMYCTDDDGTEKFYFHLKKTENGHAELGGNDDNLVRYSVLNEKFNELKSDFNSLVSMYNSHIHITTATIGAGTVPGVISPTTSQGSNSTASITASKIIKLKTYKEEEN